MLIIGAGLAGLSTGCYAQMNGYKTHILEHGSRPGGVVASWKRGDYIIDGGIHFVWGHRPGHPCFPLYRELGVYQDNHFPELNEYCRYIDQASKKSVAVTRDLDQLTNDLKCTSPADNRVVDDLIACARALQGANIGEMGLDTPPELTGLRTRLVQLWRMRGVFKYFTGKYAGPVTEYVKSIRDPWLRNIVTNIFLPEAPLWFVLMFLGELAEGQLGLPEGGSHSFVHSIENRYIDLGGRVTYGANVEEILVEGMRTCGLRLANGDIHRADIVVSAADGYSTIFKMLGGNYINSKIKKRYQNWKLFSPLVLASFGVARRFDGEPCFNMLFLERPFYVGGQTIDKIFVRIFNYGTDFAPSGKTVIQAQFETEWDYWSQLQKKDRLDYERQKEQVLSQVLERLEETWPGTAGRLEVTDMTTPYTTWRYTRNHKGSYEGWLPVPEVINNPVERTLPGLKGFYMAGQWVMPGGGVLPCLYSGRHVVQILCRQEGKPFLTTSPIECPCYL